MRSDARVGGRADLDSMRNSYMTATGSVPGLLSGSWGFVLIS